MKYNWTLPTSIFFLLSCLVILIDQITKYIVRERIAFGVSVPLINNILYLTHTTNKGASFSLFTNYSFFLTILTTAVLICIIIFYKKIPHNYRLAFALIAGGAAGNLIDRIFLGTVTDFIDIRIWPVFNLADAAITLAAIFLVIIAWKE